MKNKKAQIDFREIIGLVSVIIVLIIIIPLISLLFQPDILSSPEKFIGIFAGIFIPLLILSVIAEFIRRIIE